MYASKPTFIVKKNMQKSLETGVYFDDQVTPAILEDVCNRILGTKECDIQFVDNNFSNEDISATYNKGRTAFLYYKNAINIISFSEININGRNSSVQSVPTAFNLFFNNNKQEKNLYYYFLDANGNIETSYHHFIYRLMATVGFQFLNSEKLIDSIIPFSSLPDLMLARRINSGRNQSNNPTYITKNSSKEIDLYGKTYGASKYETSLLCYAISNIANRTKQNINLYQVAEGNLQILPQSSLSVIEKMNNIKLIQADMILERKAFAENDSLRSPKYIYNLLDRLGPKKCAFCDCRIPEIIQGAHILPVSRIKQNNLLSFEQKLQHATDGHNGLWLCENHHKLFDENIININLNGKLVIDSHIASDDKMFIEKITTNYSLASEILTDEFIEYLNQRNSVINF